MSPRVNIETARPWRLAARNRSTASWPLRATPLPSRSIKARCCLAIGRLASAALRYHSTARVESRSTTKPRSYITPTLKADCAEPCWAARSSQPAPACWSLGTPTPCTRRRAISSMAGSSSALALVRSSSIGRAAQSIEAAGSVAGGAGVSGAVVARANSALVGSGGAAASGTTIGAVDFASGFAGIAVRAGGDFVWVALAVRGDDVCRGQIAHAPAVPNAAARITPPIRRAGRFTPMPRL